MPPPMFKALKDARRRSVETILGAMGSTERTADPEFDAHSQRFLKMLDDMYDCKSMRFYFPTRLF